MTTTHHFSLLVILFLSVSISVHGNGFSVNMIHRDSPDSPFYNPLDTSTDRFQKVVHHLMRPLPAAGGHGNGNDTIRASVIANKGEFLLNISLGTPPRQVLAIIDTGSDLTWLTTPIFDPKKSSTYTNVPCASRTCEKFHDVTCQGNLCQYGVAYGDRSYSEGNLAFETLSFDSTSGRSVKLPRIAIGCGHNSAGTFSQHGTGMVGLGGGGISLASQLGSRIESKFSYCLLPFDSTHSSKLNFGSHAEITGKGVVSTPLISSYDQSQQTFYYLSLEGISVNENKVPFQSSSSSMEVKKGRQARHQKQEVEGNIIIDSGTTLTLLPSSMYTEFESEIMKAIDAEPIPAPEGLSLCYSEDPSLSLPDITVHFTDADVELESRNSFALAADGVVCVLFVPTDSVPIYGNIARADELVRFAISLVISFDRSRFEFGFLVYKLM
ncbi:hypothetical protein MKW98_027743 [Papaver atlanticum]|uniref:Peptidase A1 domain-containing protein n=1 Tax=Papaver atlanticum TaxID=357466 RepID=A0AAD4TC38_9MAGN|nr:hypothetical protein MKW98_027743 [Papaver atlanticum]